MNDEFLYRLRVQPPATFAAKLKARLEIEAVVAAAKRRARRLVMVCGILLGAAAVAFVTPTVRTGIASWVGEFGSRHEAEAGAQVTRVREPTLESNGVPSVRAGTSVPRETPAQPSAPQTANDVVALTDTQSAVAPAGTRSARSQIVLSVVSIQAPSAITDAVFESFRKAYGYEVRNRDVSEGEPVCTRWVSPDAAVMFGPMSDADRANCSQAGNRFIEVPLGYEAYVAVVNRDNTWADPLTVKDLQGATDRMHFDPLTTWNQIRPSWPSLPITLFGVDSTERSSNAGFTPPGQKFSLPISIRRDDASIPRAIDATYGGLGFMNLGAYTRYAQQTVKAGGIPVKVVAVVNTHGTAVLPSQKTIQDGSYDVLSRPLLLYLNVDRLAYPWLSLFGTHSVEAASQRVGEEGLTPVDKLGVDTAVRRIRTARDSR